MQFDHMHRLEAYIFTLQVRNFLLPPGAAFSWYRNHNKEFQKYYANKDQLVFCCEIPNLVHQLGKESSWDNQCTSCKTFKRHLHLPSQTFKTLKYCSVKLSFGSVKKMLQKWMSGVGMCLPHGLFSINTPVWMIYPWFRTKCTNIMWLFCQIPFVLSLPFVFQHASAACTLCRHY